MIIAIDLTALYDRKHTGIELYAIDLYKALLRTSHIIVPIFHVLNEIDNNENAYVIPKNNRLWLENVSIIKAIKKIKADYVLFPIFPPPYTIYGKTKSKIIPTIHDFAFLKFRDTLNFAAKYYLTPKYKRAFKKSDAIITISEYTLNILRDYTIKPIINLGENISSKFINVDDKKSIDYLSKWNLKKDSYIISVSTIEPRKNFKYLLKVIKPYLIKNDLKLVLVGRKGWGDDLELKNLIEDMANLLVFTEYVEIDCLISLYCFAHSFALLSLDEGFGRTPFEAVACGCRKLILSDIPVFREGFDNNALFLPLNNELEATSLILNSDLVSVSNDFAIPFHVLEDRIHLLDNI